jgi:hypothetical protein
MAEVGDVHLEPDEARLVESVINEVVGNTEEIARGLAAHGETIQGALRGSGTATAADTYSILGGAGRLLSEHLNKLREDLGLSITTGEETDLDVDQQVRAGNSQVAQDVAFSV